MEGEFGGNALETVPVQQEAGGSRDCILPPPCIFTRPCLLILLTNSRKSRERQTTHTVLRYTSTQLTPANKYFTMIIDNGEKQTGGEGRGVPLHSASASQSSGEQI